LYFINILYPHIWIYIYVFVNSTSIIFASKTNCIENKLLQITCSLINVFMKIIQVLQSNKEVLV